MNPMKSKTAHSLIISLILTVGYLTTVQAVTDAELEALEKQIEQQEAEEKQKAEAEAKRKAELIRKRLEKEKRLAEKQAEEKEKDEAGKKRMTEVAVRLRKDPKDKWFFDSKTGCAVWSPKHEDRETFTWSGNCVDGMLSGKGVNDWFENDK